jgi:mannose-6-phosphate isomerase-like protein (cupin superfamily)
MRLLPVVCAVSYLLAAERAVDPTFLRRSVPDVRDTPADLTSSTCRYKPIFGAGDADARILRGIARFGEITVTADGSSETVRYPAEEQVYVVLEGSGTITYGEKKLPVRKGDFLYLPAGIPHAISAASGASCRAIVMGFRIPAGANASGPAQPEVANIEEVKTQTVGGHPDSVLYRLLMGDTTSTRDRIAAGHVLTSLFVMEFEPGGTNFPHHHETEEEIYLVLSGRGEMVAGGGMNGVEARFPAKAGDAYFFRLNCTVGFYASKDAGEPARILAVRSRFPFGRR